MLALFEAIVEYIAAVEYSHSIARICSLLAVVRVDDLKEVAIIDTRNL